MSKTPCSQLTRKRGRRLPVARLSLFVLALLALPCLVSAQDGRVDRQSRPGSTEEKTPTSRLRGRVVYDDTGRPVRRARVLLLKDGSTEGTGASALTNARGEFEIKEVEAGRYFIVVEGPGLLTPYSFLDVESTQTNDIDFNAFRDQFDAVTLDGRTDADVQVRARRGGSITGKVTYENGDPAINITVTLLRRTKGRLRQYLGGVGEAADGSVETDDRGVYRFAGLPPGEYLVSISEQIEHGNGEGGGDGEEGPSGYNGGGTPLVVTYYPAATRVADAGSIKVSAGEEHAGADITLVERGLYTLAGVVRDRRTGRPIANVHLGLHLKEGEAEEMPLIIDHNTQTDEQGRWQFNELPDGLYVLTIQPQQETDPSAMDAFQRNVRAAIEARDQAALENMRPPIPAQKFATKQQDVTIEGEDLTNLNIELSAGGHISGTIVIEGGKEPPPYVSIYAETATTGTRAAYTSPTTAQHGHFVIGGIQPGKVFFGINVGGEEHYYVKSVTANGITYTREPVPIEDGAVIKGARIVLASELAKLKGRVVTLREEEKNKERVPASGAAVLLVPANSSLWRWYDLQQLIRTNLDGTYEIDAPPGDYLAFVLPADERPRIMREEEIKQFSVGASRITLRAGKTEELELTAPEN